MSKLFPEGVDLTGKNLDLELVPEIVDAGAGHARFQSIDPWAGCLLVTAGEIGHCEVGPGGWRVVVRDGWIRSTSGRIPRASPRKLRRSEHDEDFRFATVRIAAEGGFGQLDGKTPVVDSVRASGACECGQVRHERRSRGVCPCNQFATACAISFAVAGPDLGQQALVEDKWQIEFRSDAPSVFRGGFGPATQSREDPGASMAKPVVVGHCGDQAIVVADRSRPIPGSLMANCLVAIPCVLLDGRCEAAELL